MPEDLPVPPWRPSVAEVARAIRARTFTDDSPGESSDPLDDVVGGALAGTFNSSTAPTDADVDGYIDDACSDILSGFAGAIPAGAEAAAKRAAALKAALAIEIGSFNGAEGSPYLQLRIDAEGALRALKTKAQTIDLFGEGAGPAEEEQPPEE
jgi:hypothetical protein